jgi:hypothetical protein
MSDWSKRQSCEELMTGKILRSADIKNLQWLIELHNNNNDNAVFSYICANVTAHRHTRFFFPSRTGCIEDRSDVQKFNYPCNSLAGIPMYFLLHRAYV